MQTYLAHHGVKGMKWGVRRYQNKDGSRTSLGKRHRAAIENPATLSDAELRTKVNRLALEKRYTDAVSSGYQLNPKYEQAAKKAKGSVDSITKKANTRLNKTESALVGKSLKRSTEAFSNAVQATKLAREVKAIDARRDAQKRASEMTYQELRDAVNRIELENQYSALALNKQDTLAGKNKVKAILKASANTASTAVGAYRTIKAGSEVATYLTQHQLEIALGAAVIATYVKSKLHSK